jgi:hypothetical protein
MAKKIALLTYHYGYNEGTLLQAFATQEILKKNLTEFEISIFDWRHSKKESLAFGPPKNKREEALKNFFNTKLERSRFCISSEDGEKAFEILNREYDIAIVGSDEVWRLDYKLTGIWPFKKYNQCNSWAPPFPNIYWPIADTLGVSCISFASSVSEHNDISRIPRSHKKLMRQSLSSFKLLSIRDTRTEDFIRDLFEGNKPPVYWLPDPTFSLNLDDLSYSFDYPKILNFKQLKDFGKKTALIVHQIDRKYSRQTISKLKKLGYFIIGVGTKHENVDLDLSKEGLAPLEWAKLPSFVDLVVTDRFHGAVFSLKSGTRVLALDHRVSTDGKESKIQDLFRRFGISDHRIAASSATDLEIEDFVERVCDGPWDTQKMRSKCLEYSQILNEFTLGLRELLKE